MNFLLLNIQEDNGRCHSSNLEKIGQSQTIYKEKILPPGHHARILIHNILLTGGAEKLILGVENIPGKIPVIFLLFTSNCTPLLALFIFVLSFTCLMRGFLWTPSMDTAHSDTGFPTS